MSVSSLSTPVFAPQTIDPDSVSKSPLDVLPAPLVPLAAGGSTSYANFDYAASAPAIRAATDAAAELLPRYSAVHRGAGWLSQRCTDSYEAARAEIATFLGCRADDQVIFTRHTTEALNLLARALPPRTRTVVFASEHHANLLPWPNPVRLPAPESPAEAVRSVVASLQVLGRSQPVLVATTGASNVTGELFPIAEIAAAARGLGARTVLDAAQLAPHRPIDVSELGVDYVALSGHKLYAPFGAGVLAGRADWLDEAPPHLCGGGASALVEDDVVAGPDWKRGPARHEAGSPNVVGAVTLAAVCRALRESDRIELIAREEALRRRLSEGLSRVRGIRQLQQFGADSDRVGVATFGCRQLPADLLAAALSAEYGIGVRDGLFCAHPLARRLLNRAGVEGQAVRASIGLGTTTQEVDRLVAAVTRLCERGPRLRYVAENGRLRPTKDVR